jgi:ribosomal protein S21
MINVSVEKNPNESASSLLRRFTKRTQESGILPRVRSLRDAKRVLSHYKTKMNTLEMIKRREDMEKLAKLGKLVRNTKKRPGQKAA